jgi:hypothetical protein
MVAVYSERKDSESNWQNAFLKMLPGIERRLRIAFCYLDHASRDEAIGEAVAHSLFAYVRLYERGRAGVATASTLAFYSVRKVKRGRPASGRMRSKEPLSRYGQLTNGIQIERPPGNWIDLLVEDKRASVVDLVAAKMDVSAWFDTLTQRMKRIATDLALGFSTSEVAKKHDVSAGRISQLRRKLADSWAAFQQMAQPELA